MMVVDWVFSDSSWRFSHLGRAPWVPGCVHLMLRLLGMEVKTAALKAFISFGTLFLQSGVSLIKFLGPNMILGVHNIAGYR